MSDAPRESTLNLALRSKVTRSHSATEPRVIGILPGEGVRPDSIEVCRQVLAAVSETHDIRFDVQTGGAIGLDALLKLGTVLPGEVIEFCREIFRSGGAILAGAGEPDSIIGSYYTHRTRSEFQEMFGFFSNPVAPRFRFPARSTFREWLAEVRRIVIDAPSHADIPFEQVCRELQQAASPRRKCASFLT